MDPHPAEDRPVDLREYIAVIRARKWTIVVVTLLAVALALAYSLRQTPLYRSEARLVLQAIPEIGYEPSTSLETESQVLRSIQVAELVAADLGTDASPESLRGGLNVTPIQDSRVLVVTYTAQDPQFAARAANSFAQSYILHQQAQAAESVVTTREVVAAQVRDVEEELTQVLRDLERAEAAGNSGLAETLEIERTSLAARLGVLQQSLDDASLGRLGIGAGEIIQPAAASSSPFVPNHTNNGVLGLLFGVVLGASIAFMRDRLDDRFRGRSDVERAVGAPVLATVPRFRVPRKATGWLVAAEDPHAPASEAYRTLRTNVRFITTQYGIDTFLVTSPGTGEGKTSSCVNLAAALAHAGSRVIVVSADLRHPTLERYFDIGNGQGLSTWLSRDLAEPWPLLQDPGIPNLRVLPSGPVPRNPAELLSSPRLAALIELLSANCDVLLVDSPPVLAVADTLTLALYIPATLLVVDVSTTHRSQTTYARDELERVGTRIVGALLNAFDPATSPYYYRAYVPHYRPAGGDGQTQSGDLKKRWLRIGRRG